MRNSRAEGLRARVREFTDPYRDVDALFDDIDKLVAQAKVNRDLGVKLAERRRDHTSAPPAATFRARLSSRSRNRSNRHQALGRSSRRRDESLSYGVAVDDPLTGQLLVIERWKDQLSLPAHLNASDTLAFVERWQDRMSGDILKYDAANERTLMDD